MYGLERWHLDRIDARSVSENTPPGQNVGEPVMATPDYTLTYSLGGTDMGEFAIEARTGQLMTKGALPSPWTRAT